MRWHITSEPNILGPVATAASRLVRAEAQAGTTGVLCVGMFASTDRSMGRCARTNSYGVNANNFRSERSRSGTRMNVLRTLSARE